tara:strand:- start:522 stop:755 length:234 start_codon:yes stop_codon:yes gene_type:complete
MSPDEEAPTIIEANSSASEFKVTEPLLVKLPTTLVDDVFSIVQVPPLSMVRFCELKIKEIIDKHQNIFVFIIKILFF